MYTRVYQFLTEHNVLYVAWCACVQTVSGQKVCQNWYFTIIMYKHKRLYTDDDDDDGITF